MVPTKNMSMLILLIVCMALILKFLGLEGSGFLKKYPNTSETAK
jgi:hypothetical protein